MSISGDPAAGLDPARMLTAVPDGSDRDEVFGWVVGAAPFRDGAIPDAVASSLLAELGWLRVDRSRRFSSDDPSEAIRAACSIAAAWSQLGAPVGLVARNGIDGLDVRFGMPSDRLTGLTGTLQATLPGIVLRAAEPPAIAPGPGPRSYLWAVPAGAGGTPPGPPLLDRLSELHRVSWQLEILMVPVPPNLLRGRSVALARLAMALAAERSVTRQVDPRTTRAFEDPVVVRLERAIGIEHDRAELALDVGALAVFASLSAADPGSLAAALGAATSSAPNAATRWRAGAIEGALPLGLLASTEAGDLLRLPGRDRYGLPSDRWVELDEHPEPAAEAGPFLILGATDRGAVLRLPFSLLTDHLLVTGASGSGKSTHVIAILRQIADVGIPYLVVEPVKDEYGSLDLPDLRRWAPGAPDPGLPWALNPLEVREGTPVATHLDRIVALFRASFGLPDPLPHLLELGLTEVYANAGWDLGSDRNLVHDGPRAELDWPTLSDLIAVCCELPSRLGYEPQVQGNLRAAFEARLGGLVRGPRGRILDRSEPFPAAEAFGSPLAINLDAIGDDHARSFFMGLVLVRLREERGSQPVEGLAHLTVVEEAHRLLGQQDGASGGEFADPTGHVADAFGDILAEIRSTGEAIVVVEQSPSRLVRGALVNTATKVALRSTDRGDQDALAAGLGLDPGEGAALATLDRHEGLVMWAGMDRPIRARLESAVLPRVPRRAEAPGHRVVLPHRWPPAVRTAAAVLVVADERDDRRARAALLDEIALHWPGAGPRVVEDLFQAAVTAEVAVLAQAHGWDRTARTAAVAGVLGRRRGTGHPRALLGSARQPHLACPVVCPGGGCPTGQLLAPAAQAVLREGPGTLVRLVQDPEERRRRLRRRVDGMLPAEAPSEIRGHALRCLTVQVFDEWADVETVSNLLPPAHAGDAP